jgi:DNA-binding transcriptional ArsR family regulator
MGLETEQADVYAAIADPTRRALLFRLADEGEKNVTQLLEPFPVSQPAISKHLRILRDAGLVHSRKSGRLRLYGVQARKLRQVFDWVSHFEKYWDEKLDALGNYLDRQPTNE